MLFASLSEILFTLLLLLLRAVHSTLLYTFIKISTNIFLLLHYRERLACFSTYKNQEVMWVLSDGYRSQVWCFSLSLIVLVSYQHIFFKPYNATIWYVVPMIIIYYPLRYVTTYLILSIDYLYNVLDILYDTYTYKTICVYTWCPYRWTLMTWTDYILKQFSGFGPLPWAIMGEIFPTNLKSVASALTASFCWILGFILTKLFSTVSDAIGIYSVFWIFAVCCILALLFTAFLLPQTEGKTLQEIQDILQGRSKSSNHKMTRAWYMIQFCTKVTDYFSFD